MARIGVGWQSNVYPVRSYTHRGSFMRPLAPSFLIVSVIVLVAACIHDEQPTIGPEAERIDRLARRLSPVLVTKGFSYAFASGDCGPTDGAAMALYLVDQPQHLI